MRVLVACEYSGTVRDAFLALGHDAMSCDLLPTDAPGPHYQGDVRDVLDGWVPVTYHADCDPDGDGWCNIRDIDPAECPCVGPTQDGVEYLERNGILFGRPMNAPHWDLMIAHPPCTHLAVSGAKWFDKKKAQQEEALDFVRLLLHAPIPRIALENPVSIISSRIRKPDQIIQPYEHGHEATKTTCLWLKGLPPFCRPTSLEKVPAMSRSQARVCQSGTTCHPARIAGNFGQPRSLASQRLWQSSGETLRNGRLRLIFLSLDPR